MRKQNGFSLIELLFVFAIVVTLALAIFRIYESVDSSRKVNHAATQVLHVYQAAAQWVGPLTAEKNLVPTFVEYGYLTKDFNNNNVNPWGGSIAAYAVGTNSIRVELSSVPIPQCKNLVNKFSVMEGSTPGDCTKVFSITLKLDNSE